MLLALACLSFTSTPPPTWLADIGFSCVFFVVFSIFIFVVCKLRSHWFLFYPLDETLVPEVCFSFTADVVLILAMAPPPQPPFLGVVIFSAH
jgi:hypothetical protein